MDEPILFPTCGKTMNRSQQEFIRNWGHHSEKSETLLNIIKVNDQRLLIISSKHGLSKIEQRNRRQERKKKERKKKIKESWPKSTNQKRQIDESSY